MVEVKFNLGCLDFLWIGIIFILLGTGLSYAYGGNSPSSMGHSAGELEIVDTNTNAQTICPNNQFLDGDGQCRTVAQIISDGGAITSVPAATVDTNAQTKCPDNQFLDGDGSCLTAAQIVSAGGTTATSVAMVSGWPDAIKCESGGDISILFFKFFSSSDKVVLYGSVGSDSGRWIKYNSDNGAYLHKDGGDPGMSGCYKDIDSIEGFYFR